MGAQNKHKVLSAAQAPMPSSLLSAQAAGAEVESQQGLHVPTDFPWADPARILSKFSKVLAIPGERWQLAEE